MSKLYFIIFGISIVGSFLSKKNYKYFLIIVLAVLMYYAYHYDYHPGTDLYRRVEEMELYRRVGFDYVVENRLNTNPLSALFFYFFSIFDNPGVLPAFTVFICYGIGFSLLLKCYDRFDLSIEQRNLLYAVFMLSFYYDQAISNIRIYICFAIVSYFMYEEIIERKYKILSWIMYVACCFFHYAILPFVSLRLLLFVKKRFKNSDIILIVGTILLFVMGERVLSVFVKMGSVFQTLYDKMDAYETYSRFGTWQYLSSIVRLIFFTCVLFYVKNKSQDFDKKDDYITFYMICVCAMIVVMYNNYQFVFRSLNYLHYLCMVPLSMFLKKSN